MRALIRCALPSMSPTVGLIWAKARRMSGDGMKRANWQTGKLANRSRSLLFYLLVCQFASLLVSATAAAEPVVLRAALSEGTALRYEAEAKLQVKSEKQSQTLEQRLSLRFTVAKVDKD